MRMNGNTRQEIVVKIRSPQHARLVSAATHRSMTLSEMCEKILVGTIVRGCVDKRLMEFHSWQIDNAVDTITGSSDRATKRRREERRRREENDLIEKPLER